MSNMRIAVAGSEGFVGKHVCEQLEKDEHEIVRIDLTRGFDLSNPDVIDTIPRVDCFIHLANLVYVPGSYEKPALYYRVNYMTTLNALEVCRRDKARLVYISSYVYGTPQYLPVDENHPICPFNPYAQTKVVCEKLCEGYHRDFGVKISVVRPFNIYGVGQKGLLLIPEIIGQLKEGKEEIQLKAASPRRDYINVVDVASAICSCAMSDEDYGIYNACSGESVSVKEITEIINRNLKHKVKFFFSASDRPNEVDETRGTCRRLESIGWKRSIDFEEGMREIIKAENL